MVNTFKPFIIDTNKQQQRYFFTINAALIINESVHLTPLSQASLTHLTAYCIIHAKFNL